MLHSSSHDYRPQEGIDQGESQDAEYLVDVVVVVTRGGVLVGNICDLVLHLVIQFQITYVAHDTDDSTHKESAENVGGIVHAEIQACPTVEQ